jgi:hypothetical protein
MDQFRIPLTIWTVMMPVPLTIVVLLQAWFGPLHGAFAALAILLPLLLTTLVSIVLLFVAVLQVGPDGLIIYRLNRLRWADVTAARHQRVFGLPYLVLYRARGGRWWVPLYFRGATDLREAVWQATPKDNPIHHALKPDQFRRE